MLPEQQEDVRQWLARARLDERSAERLLSGPDPLTETAVYHCQQLAEKALKVYLISIDQPFRRTHDLIELTSICSTSDPSFVQLEPFARGLNPYAVAFRYPTNEPRPTLDEANERLVWAKQVLIFVLDRLPPELR